ncbi:MAG TPA: hypothetical protein VNH18_10770, partial [Bryobacteraceae bacterium]|nr:hypothetical protein [Bryobacteraceae bacterium]
MPTETRKRRGNPERPPLPPRKSVWGGTRLTLLASLALCALALLAYSNSFTAGFALDNQVLLLGDPRIREVTRENLSQILHHTYWWPNGEAGIFRPLTTLTYLLNYAVLGHGAHPAGYHWINYFLHAGNTLLAFVLMLRLTHAFRTSLAIAAVWAVHPVLTESVTNIIGRADLIAATSVLGGFLFYLKATEASGWRRAGFLFGLTASAAAGAASKESAVVLPGVILLYEWLIGRRWARLPLAGLATLPPIAAALWWRWMVLAASPPAEFPFVDNPIAGAAFWTGRLTAIKVLARYLWVTVWPLKLSSDYSYSEIPLAKGDTGDWLAVAAMAVVCGLVARLYSRNRPAFFFACFTFLNLLPASNLLFPIGTIMAERLLYLPALGIVACLVLVASRLPVRVARFGPIVCCVIVAAFALRTWVRNADWSNDLTMSLASVQTSPNSFKVHRLLADALFRADSSRNYIDRVVAEADKSLAILSDVPDDRNLANPWNLAAAFHLAKGDATLNGDPQPQYREAARIAQRSIAIELASREAYQKRHKLQTPVPPAAADAYR